MTLQLQVGQTVVHPHHGPATVTSFMTRAIRGEERAYANLTVTGTNLEVSIPVDTAEEIGVREPMSAETMTELFGVLTAPSGPQEETWSRRIKAQAAQFHTGDLAQIAEVVRELSRRQEGKGISAGEKELLRDAMRPLAAELAICLDLDEGAAADAVTVAVLEGTVPDRELATAG